MARLKTHADRHLIDRIGWLRVAVLGANDGIVSTASLIVGVAAASDEVLQHVDIAKHRLRARDPSAYAIAHDHSSALESDARR